MTDPASSVSAPSTPAGTFSTGAPAPPGWDVRTDTLPEHFGRYHVRRLLGRGGMGSVYLAHDTELDRPVALKVPHFAAEEGSDAFERFRREARAAATLSHPNICRVYDVGVRAGVPYLTMSYIEGQTLAARVKAGPPLSLRQAAVLVRKLAEALAEAHRRGVIHRDLKPSNVMIEEGGEPVIMDFGLARRATKGDARLTHEGQVMGTPAYMAPEQAAGQSVGPACDVYSLGVILYELLAGRLPFQGEGLSELLAQVLAVAPAPPSAYRPGLDPALESICLTAMAKSPVQRYASMADFAAALAHYLDSGTQTLPAHLERPHRPETPAQKAETRTWPPPSPDGPARGRGRRKWLLASAVLVALGTGLLLALPLLTNSRDPVPSPGEGGNKPEHRLVPREVLTAIRDHLEPMAPEDRPSQRYFTLAHLHGAKGVTEADLRGYREALARLINRLSREAEVVVPAAVDRKETVFAIDLRRVGWQRDRLWDEVLKAYPYGLHLQNHSDPAVRELAEQVAALADPHCDVLCVRADWFVARASQPPLLRALLRLPGSAREAEKDLKADADVAALVRHYQQDVGPEDAARELGIADGAAFRARLAINPELRRRGLGALAEGKAIPRQTWDSAAGRTASLFQEAAELLDCGIPVTFFDID